MTEVTVTSPTVEEWMPQEAKELRRNAPDYFVELIESGVLENITSLDDLEPGSVTALEGGVSSACYIIQNNGESQVLKLRNDGMDAEAKALQIWEKTGASIPKVFSSGTISSTVDTALPVKYLLLEGIVDESGNGAPLASTYIDTNPSANAEIAYAMGGELAKMHRATSSRPIGPYADMWEAKLDTESWSQFLIDDMMRHKRLLTELGFSDEQIGMIRHTIGNLPEPEESVYLHNDFAPRNTLVKATDPLAVSIFDPNPIVGDRHWDLARQVNRHGIAQKKAEANPANNHYQSDYARERQYVDSLFTGYTAADQTIDGFSLAANTLVHALEWQGRREGVAARRFGDTEGKAWLAGNREVIREQANKVLKVGTKV